MQTLPYKEVTYKKVTYGKLEDFVTNALCLMFDWSFVADQESNNMTYELFHIDPEEFDQYDKAKVDAFLADPKQTTGMARRLLVHLCNIGRIEPGVYLVEVNW